MTAKRIYVAGPMTGLPESNYPAFNAAAAILREQGFDVVNPAENNLPADSTWQDYMRVALRQEVACDVVFLLPGWKRSRGARIEHHVARGLGLEVWFAEGPTACAREVM